MGFKKFPLLFFTIFLLFISSCEEKNTDPCYTYDVITDCIGFPTLYFVLRRNGENIFNENTTTLQDIVIQGDDSANGELELQTFDSLNGPILTFLDTDWELGGNHSYTINVEDIDSFSLDTSFTISEGACCGGIPILDQIQINNIQGIPNSETGYYIIELD